jgi:hypothetical protein
VTTVFTSAWLGVASAKLHFLAVTDTALLLTTAGADTIPSPSLNRVRVEPLNINEGEGGRMKRIQKMGLEKDRCTGHRLGCQVLQIYETMLWSTVRVL